MATVYVTATHSDRCIDRYFGLSTTSTQPNSLALTTTAGSTGTAGTEVTGGSYARQSLSWTIEAGELTAKNDPVVFYGMPAATVVGFDIYNGTTRLLGGTFASSVTTTAGQNLKIPSNSIRFGIARYYNEYQQTDGKSLFDDYFRKRFLGILLGTGPYATYSCGAITVGLVSNHPAANVDQYELSGGSYARQTVTTISQGFYSGNVQFSRCSWTNLPATNVTGYTFYDGGNRIAYRCALGQYVRYFNGLSGGNTEDYFVIPSGGAIDMPEKAGRFYFTGTVSDL